MNILLINHYAGSPKMGMEYRPYYLAKEWIKMGHSVSIIAANYSHIRQFNPKLTTKIELQNIDNIQYIWVKTPEYKGNGIGRILNIFKFINTLSRKAKQISQEINPDVVIASSTYPSDNYVAQQIAKKSGAKHFYEVHDLWPLSPMELGNMSKKHPFIMAMQHAENYAYKKANGVISMLPKTQGHMQAHGLDLNKWHYVPNGILLSEWKNRQALNKKTNDLIENYQTKFKNSVAYAGTFGIANALKSYILAGKEKKDTAFFLIGKGPEKENLKQLINKHQLDNVFIIDPISKSEIPELLNKFDYLFIGLQYQPLFRFGISPNKLIDYMMASKPIIQAIRAGNNVVKDAQCGIDIEPENSQAIVNALKTLESYSKEKLKNMGNNGKLFVLKHHDYRILAKKMIDIFKKPISL